MQDVHLNSSLDQWGAAGLLRADRAYRGDSSLLGLLLGGVCLGIPALIGVLVSFCCKCSDPRNLTVFTVSLLFMTILQSLSTPVLALQVMGQPCYSTFCQKLAVVWFASRRCGTLLHLLAALEFILHRRQSRIFANMRSVYWCLPIVLTVDLICLLYHEVVQAAVALGVVITVTAQATCIMACSRCSGTLTNQTVKVAALAVFACVTYCPSFVLECMVLNQVPVSAYLYDVVLCLTNLRLVADPMLCLVISRNPPEESPEQTDIGLDNQGLEP